MSGILLKNAVKDLMDAVSGIAAARVYTSQKTLSSDAVIKAVLCDPATGKANAWMMSATEYDDSMKSVGQTGTNQRLYTLEMIGYYTIDETTTPPSEDVFLALNEACATAIASGIRARLGQDGISTHVVKFPTIRLMYALFPFGGGLMYHKSEWKMTFDWWYQRS